MSFDSIFYFDLHLEQAECHFIFFQEFLFINSGLLKTPFECCNLSFAIVFRFTNNRCPEFVYKQEVII